jgi:hypothetical protein
MRNKWLGEQVHAILDELESTRHNYDPEEIKKVEVHARAARILTAAGHTNFNTCAIEAQMRAGEGEQTRDAWLRSHGVSEMRHDVPFPPLGSAIYQEYFDTPTYQGRQCVVGGFMVRCSFCQDEFDLGQS